jgi:hypothetical protein
MATVKFGNNVYECDLVDGKRHGKGKMAYPGDDVYEGDFVENLPHGKVKMIYYDGRVAEGNWKEGNFQG